MNLRIPLISLGILALWVSLAGAALDSVSGWDGPQGAALVPTIVPGEVAYSLANGFPIWYEDENGLKLQLCLDQAVERAGGGIFRPCFTEEPLAGSPISFPGNFGAEAFWWGANAATVFSSRQNGAVVAGGDMLFVAQLEAAFAGDLGAIDGDQVAFSRIRLRISVPRPGIYRVTHPYGTFTYRLEDVGRRVINQTQDIGNFDSPGPPPMGDFTEALFDGEPPFGGASPPLGFDFSANAGIVDVEGRSIGPFLVAADAPGGIPLDFIEAVNGDLYLADPGFGAIHLEVPVTGSTFEFDPEEFPGVFANFFQLELVALLVEEVPGVLTPVFPDLEGDRSINGFYLNAADDSQIVHVDEFQLSGKLFNDGPNLKPVANDDLVVIAKGRTGRIDVLDNVEDPVGPGNVHGINPQALGLPTNPDNLREEILLTRALTTPAGGTVQRFTTISTGRAFFTYTPPSPDFTGEDFFDFVVQDTGGLISDPARVTVIVEDLQAQRAEYRPRLGKWRIAGTSSRIDGNAVEVLAGPVAAMTGASVLPTPVVTDAVGRAALALHDNRIDYVFSVDPLPTSPVIFATIHITAPGESIGPSVFFLFDDILDGVFTGSFSDSLTNFIARPSVGVNTFADAVAAILEGRAYLNIYTEAHSFGGGELRGAIDVPLVGTADVVDVNGVGTWIFEGKSTASPGTFRQVNLRSAGGVTVLGVPLQLR